MRADYPSGSEPGLFPVSEFVGFGNIGIFIMSYLDDKV